MKQCSRCKQTKPLSEFFKNRSKRDGLSDRCKICKSYEMKTTDYHKNYYKNWHLSRIAGIENAVEVFNRAGHKCEECGDASDLLIHHIDNKGRNSIDMGLEVNKDLDNLQVLCRPCHARHHMKIRSRKVA